MFHRWRWGASWRGDAHPAVMQGRGALASVHHCYRTQQVRGLFFPLIWEDFLFYAFLLRCTDVSGQGLLLGSFCR